MSQAPRTMFASAALRIAGVLGAEVSQIRLGVDTPRQVKVLEPDGPSTHGGKLARLSIVLAPVSGEGQNLMCGWLDVGSAQAGLRSYDSMAAQFQSRFGGPVDFSSEDYDGLVRIMNAFLAKENYKVSMIEEGSSPGAPEAKAASREATRMPTQPTHSRVQERSGGHSTGVLITVALISFLGGGILGAVLALAIGG